MHRCQEPVEAERLLAVLPPERHQLGSLVELVEPPVRLAQRRVGERVSRILLQSLLPERDGALQVVGSLEALPVAARLEVERVGVADDGTALAQRVCVLI